jgi:hypothetical protein
MTEPGLASRLDDSRGEGMALSRNGGVRRLGVILAGGGAALVGYLGLGVSLWQIAPGAMVQIIYVESTALLSLVAFSLYQASYISSLEESAREVSPLIAAFEQSQRLAQSTFGLVVNLIEEPRVDQVHHFRCITEEYFIHGNDGTFNWTFDGECSAHRSMALIVKVSGDSPCDVKALAIAVTDELRAGSFLDYEVLTDRPYCKVLAIYFAKPLGNGDSFKVRFSCRWNNTFPRSRRYDYVFSQWGSYALGGVDKIVGRLAGDLPLSNFKLAKFEDGEWVDTTHQPREVDSSRNRTELQWNIVNPVHIYLLSFEKPG